MLAISIIAAGIMAVAVALLIRQVLELRAVAGRRFERQAAGVADPRRGGVFQFPIGVSPFRP